MHAAKAATLTVQLHSGDGRLRLRPHALFSIVFEHVCTVQELAVLGDLDPWWASATTAGITEWQGTCEGRVVSLGWDWVRLDDGALLAAPAVGPRSNVMLLDRRGYDAGVQATDDVLRELIATIAWEGEAAQAARGATRGLI